MCNEGIKVYYFSLEEYLGCEGSISCVVFCLDSCRGQVSHNRQFDEKGVALLWIGVAYVNVMGRVWIICFYTVVRFFGYGALPLRSFGVSWFLPVRVIDLLACEGYRLTG